MSSPTMNRSAKVMDRSREVELFQTAGRTRLSETAERQLGDLLTGTIDWD